MSKGDKGRKRPGNPGRRKSEGVFIIPVMGPTGAGKSFFINELIGHDVARVGHGLDSCTDTVQSIEVPVDKIMENLPFWTPESRRLVLVDTPGFDDTCADDSEILRTITDWLVDVYGRNAKLAGVIYLQDICQRRVTGATKRNFEVFDKLCGDDACKSVVLGTTRWSKVSPDDREVAERRESQLREIFWQGMITRGSNMMRADDAVTSSSPWRLVETVLAHGHAITTLRIQEELVEVGKSLPQTDAAVVLRRRIEELIKDMKKSGATKEDIRALVKDVRRLRELSPFLKRLAHFLG